MNLWGAVVETARKMMGPHRDRRRSERRQGDFSFPVSGRDLQTSDLIGPSAAAFESGVIRVIRSAVSQSSARRRRVDALEEAASGSTVAVIHPDATVVATRPTGLRVEPDEEPAQLPDFDEFNRVATSCDDTLAQDILRYFDSVGILPITGVSDPSLREKLANPSTYGWDRRVQQTAMRSGVSNPQLPSLRVWRLHPAHGNPARVGQNVILSDSGDVFVETSGPWGTTWIHRAPNGRVTSREHRVASARPQVCRPRIARARVHSGTPGSAPRQIAM